MIDPSNGHIKLPFFEIKPGQDLAELVNSIETNLKIEDMKTGWKWLKIKNVQVEDRSFHFGVGFLNEQLAQLDLCFDSEKTKDLEAWEKQDELKRLKLYNDWLRMEIGDQQTFDWGMVRSGYDPKGGFSSVQINYIY